MIFLKSGIFIFIKTMDHPVMSNSHRRIWPSRACRYPLISSGPLRFVVNASPIDMPGPTPPTAPGSRQAAAETEKSRSRLKRVAQFALKTAVLVGGAYAAVKLGEDNLKWKKESGKKVWPFVKKK